MTTPTEKLLEPMKLGWRREVIIVKLIGVNLVERDSNKSYMSYSLSVYRSYIFGVWSIEYFWTIKNNDCGQTRAISYPPRPFNNFRFFLMFYYNPKCFNLKING